MVIQLELVTMQLPTCKELARWVIYYNQHSSFPIRQLVQLDGELDVTHVFCAMLEGMQERPGDADLPAMMRVDTQRFQVIKV